MAITSWLEWKGPRMIIKELKIYNATSAKQAATIAVILANDQNCLVKFEYNQVQILAAPGDDADVLAKNIEEEAALRSEAPLTKTPLTKIGRPTVDHPENWDEHKNIVTLGMTAICARLAMLQIEINPIELVDRAEQWAIDAEARITKGESLKQIVDETLKFNDNTKTALFAICVLTLLLDDWVHKDALEKLTEELKKAFTAMLNSEPELAEEEELPANHVEAFAT